MLSLSAVLALPSWTLVLSALLAYFLSVSVYRLYLHPLRHIPGPKIAALTWAYEQYYDVLLPGQYNFHLQRLHAIYGPILRVNPSEVHISDKSFLSPLYDSRKRDKLPEHSLDIESSVAGTAQWQLHKSRRHSMIPFFSPRAVSQLEPLLLAKRNRLVSTISSILSSSPSSSSPPTLNLSDLYFAFCWDIIHVYAFSIPSDLLSDLPLASTLRNASNSLLLQCNYTRHFRHLTSLLSLPFLPASLTKVFTPPGVADLAENSKRVAENVREVLSDKSTSAKEIEQGSKHKSIFYQLRDDPELPLEEKAELRLAREGNFLVVAGSDSPARAIATTHFYILENPAVLAKLREELAKLGPEPELKELEGCEYLNACLLEGNRLSFGLTRRMLRVAVEEDMVYGDFVIPRGTPTAVSSLAVHTDEEVFPEPWEFRPERWTGEGVKERRRYMMSFGAKGPRSCLGIHLAEAEMRLAISGVVMGFEMGLRGTDRGDVEYRHDFQMSFGRFESEGVRVGVEGVRKG